MKRTKPSAAYAEIEDVVRRRDEIPSDQALADKHGFSRAYIQQLMNRIRKRFADEIDKKTYVSCGTNLSHTINSSESPSAVNCEAQNGKTTQTVYWSGRS